MLSARHHEIILILPPAPIPTRQMLILLVPQPYLPSRLLVFFSLFNSKESNYLSFHVMPSHWSVYSALLYCYGPVWISEKPELHCHKLKRIQRSYGRAAPSTIRIGFYTAPSTVRGNIQDFNFKGYSSCRNYREQCIYRIFDSVHVH